VGIAIMAFDKYLGVFVIAAVGGAFLVCSLFYLTPKVMTKKLVQRDLAWYRSLPGYKPWGSPKTAEISEQGLTESSSYHCTSLSWPYIYGVAEEEGRIVFLGAFLAVRIIPRSAFATDSEFRAFLAAAREYQKKNKEAQVPANAGSDKRPG
jgi:hypothetical protein